LHLHSLGDDFARGNLPFKTEEPVTKFLHKLWSDESGQDIAEYAVMLAVILVIVVGTIRLIGSNANTVFSQVGSSIQ
jgi:pilus assembly protein Flp/PilA